IAWWAISPSGKPPLLAGLQIGMRTVVDNPAVHRKCRYKLGNNGELSMSQRRKCSAHLMSRYPTARLFLGLKAPVRDWRVTHGFCEPCRAHVESDRQIVPPPSGPVLILSRRSPPGSEPFGLPPEIVAARPVVRLDRRGVDLTHRSAYRGPDRRAPGSDV